MRVTYYDDISDPDLTYEMIVLSSFTIEDVRCLGICITNLITGKEKKFSLNKESFVQLDNCELTFELTKENRGVFNVGNGRFVCGLTKDGFIELYEFLRPFFLDISGFQFLVDPIGGIELLLSNGGGW